jgi:tetratricopeptide (TPR) repeat protein
MYIYYLKRTVLKYCCLLILLLTVTSCSNKKNTALSRGYHNLTSRYNILFNGWESYKKGMLNLEGAIIDDYTELLPVFIYYNKDQNSAISSEMDRAIKKATKVISLHSITAKPEIDESKQLNAKEREYYNKNEYNKWVDDAYLLLGKSHFFKNEYKEAGETFQYIISSFPKSEPQFEARIWLARLALEKNRLKEAENILIELANETELPKHLISEYNSTKAAYEIKNKNYPAAIESLTLSLETIKSKFYKQRFNYILAQLNQKTGNTKIALEYFHKVIKLNPPYEMTFNARINMALSYESGDVSRKDIEKQLQKMLRDDKNIDFQDQIYYAWGNLYVKENNKANAIDYYIKSASVSKGNTIQQAKTYLTIADIYYEMPRYTSAQAYYDSAVRIIDQDYANYNIIYAKSISLTNLVENIETIELEDSVQKLSYLPQAELYAYIDNIIKNKRKQEEEERQREQERLLSESLNTQQQFELQTSSGSWYFYNPTAVNLGRQEFRRKWGNRRLEDNWRRLNKSTIDFGSTFANDTGSGVSQSETPIAKKSSDKYSRDYYLVDIPFTDSAMEVSHQRIQEAYFEMGGIYSDELKDYAKATNSYNELLRRYPTYENKLQVYYKLYTIGKQTNNINLISSYQQKIINEFPNSNYAMVLTDPEYFKKIEKLERRDEEIYLQVYKSFKEANYVQTASLIKKTLQEATESKYISQYDYMLTISEGVSKDTVSFIADLQKLISRYPNTEIASLSQLLIGYLGTKNPEAVRKQAIIEAATLFVNLPDEEHYVVISTPKSQNVNQLMFNIINFNIDNFTENDLKVKKTDVSGHALLQVTSFENKKNAEEYYVKIKNYQKLFNDVDFSGSNIFYISKTNFNLLTRDKKFQEYLTFFDENIR